MQFFLKTLYTLLITVVVAVAFLFLGTKVDLFGYQVKVVQSGSMEPAIGVGSVVIITETNAVAIDDVITFGEDTATKIPITHRIVAEKIQNGETVYVTKGDANENTDPGVVAASDIIGEVWLTIPYVGHVVEFVRTPLGYGLLVGIPALVIVFDELADIVWEVRKYRARKRAGKVGYRVPSRECAVPQRPVAPLPQRSRANGLASNHPAPTNNRFTLDVRDVGRLRPPTSMSSV
jgi:signal peptidase